MSDLPIDTLPAPASGRTPEPVLVAAAIQALILAILALCQVFSVFSLSDGQTGAILGVYAALVAVWGAITRQKVTPV